MNSVVKEMAVKIKAIENCQKSKNWQWEQLHTERLEKLVKEAMPSGSGFDNGTRLDENSTSERIVFITSFHHMDENGFYDGWTDHKVIVTPNLLTGFSLRVTGRDRNQIKDYIGDCFHTALAGDIPQY